MVLALNRGSSSVKFRLAELDPSARTEHVIAQETVLCVATLKNALRI